MPSKKKKYNARFPAGRIKKIMQTDEEVGKVAQAVPVIISRTLELFVESLLTKTLKITNARNAKTLSPSHMKQCIISESRFDFLRDLVKNIPDMGINEELSGSEAGYGNEGTSPASTSTSSSSVSYSNGAAAAAAASLGSHHPYETSAHPASYQRSESYSPATATISLLSHHSQPHSHKRGLSQGGSLNFYKEIQLEGTESPPPPPPKLNRLNSAPAGGAPTAALPFKIDILPNLPTVAGITSPPTSSSSSSSSSSSLAKGTTAQTPVAITPQITYNFDRLAATSPSTATPKTMVMPASAVSLEPVIKLDYSNLRLPATSASPHGSSARSTAAQQPTIKIDLSSIATRGSPAATPDGGTPKKQPAEGAAGKHYASPTTSTTVSSLNPATVQSPVAAAAAPPLFATLSSTIPGMDEDYDDI